MILKLDSNTEHTVESAKVEEEGGKLKLRGGNFRALYETLYNGHIGYTITSISSVIHPSYCLVPLRLRFLQIAASLSLH